MLLLPINTNAKQSHISNPFEISPLFSLLMAVKQFLIIGCGSGRIMQLVLEESAGSIKEIWGIDHCLYALNYAKKNLKNTFPNFPRGRIYFVQGDISYRLPFQFHNYFNINYSWSFHPICSTLGWSEMDKRWL